MENLNPSEIPKEQKDLISVLREEREKLEKVLNEVKLEKEKLEKLKQDDFISGRSFGGSAPVLKSPEEQAESDLAEIYNRIGLDFRAKDKRK
jgi:hypothetical protein